MSHFDFIEIGVCDFDTLIGNPAAKNGLSVEPVSAYFKKFPERPGVQTLRAAVSDYDGVGFMYYIPPETLLARKLPSWLRGCNALNKTHQTVKNKIAKGKLEADLVIKEPCRVLSVPTLITTYNIKTVDYLKIDTEGHDCIILNQFIEIWRSCALMEKPKHIRFETNALTALRERKYTIAALESLGYSIHRNAENTDAYL